MRSGGRLAPSPDRVLDHLREFQHPVTVDADTADIHGAEIDLGDVFRHLKDACGQDADEERHRTIRYASLDVGVVGGERAIDRGCARAIEPVGRGAGRAQLLVPEVIQRVHRELGPQVVRVGDERANRNHVELGPAINQRRHGLVHPLEGVGDHAVIAAREGREIGQVLERHGRALPERTDKADIDQIVAHRLHRVLELVERATIGLAPGHLVGVAIVAQELVDLWLQHLLHHRDPHVLHGVARADLDGQRRLRAGADIEKRNRGGASGSGHHGAACQSGHVVSSGKWAALHGPVV